MNKTKYKELLELHPEFYKDIYSQETEESRKIIYEYLNSSLISDKEYLSLLKLYKDNINIQKRLLEYATIPIIRNNEKYLLYMINLDNDILEKRMRILFKTNKIKTDSDLYFYSNILNNLNKIKVLKKLI